MSINPHKIISALALTVGVISPSIMAQQVEGPQDQANAEKVLESVVVTGQVLYSDQVTALKTPTPIIDVPQSLTIVTADQIALRGFDSVSDIINYVPGVNNSQGEGHRDAIVFRGVRSTADFFIDGTRDDVQYYRPLYNIEQVEILRGPNALLFGRGGTGGILNRVTKKAELGKTFAGYQVNVDTFGAAGVQFDINTPISDKVGFRLNGMAEYLDNHRDFYEGDQFAINPTLNIELSPKATLNLSYEYLDHSRFIDRGIPVGSNGEPVEAFKDITFGDPDANFSDLKADLYRANLQYQFNDNLKGLFNVFYGDYDKLYQNFYPASYTQASTPDEITLDGYVDTTQRQNLILTGDLVGGFQTGSFEHKLLIGAEYIDSQNDNDRYNSFFSASQDDRETFTISRPLSLRGGVGRNASGLLTINDFTADLNDQTEASVEVVSLFIQDEIALSDQFDIILGARFDQFDIDVNNIRTPADSGSSSDDNISPRLGLVYKPKENISLYGSYSESFLPRSGEQFANINSDNALDANTYTNLEAGVKWDIFTDLSLTAAIFEIEESSPQTADSDPSTLDVIDTITEGFEVQLQGQLTDDWFISAGYSYLDGNQVNAQGIEGNRKRELPENMFSLWNAYQVTRDFGLGIGLTYQDESFANNSNTSILPAYTRVDASAFYDVSEHLRLQLNIENLTDEVYYPSAHSTHQVTVGAPLNARFTVSGRF